MQHGDWIIAAELVYLLTDTTVELKKFARFMKGLAEYKEALSRSRMDIM